MWAPPPGDARPEGEETREEARRGGRGRGGRGGRRGKEGDGEGKRRAGEQRKKSSANADGTAESRHRSLPKSQVRSLVFRRALQRGGCSQDLIGDARVRARAFDDGPGVLPAENRSQVLVQLRKQDIK